MCRKLILGRDMRAASWCDLDLTFDLAVVILSLKTCLACISETMTCRKVIHGKDG